MGNIKAGDEVYLVARVGYTSPNYAIHKATVMKVTPTGIVSIKNGNLDYRFKPTEVTTYSPTGYEAMGAAKMSHSPNFELFHDEYLENKREWLNSQIAWGNLKKVLVVWEKSIANIINTRDLNSLDMLVNTLIEARNAYNRSVTEH